MILSGDLLNYPPALRLPPVRPENHVADEIIRLDRMGTISRGHVTIDWQGRRESNSQPLVLETSALPIELHP